jgi:hypothetical protein
MKRMLLILAAVVATGGIAAAPAVAGIAGNPSFSHQIPVPVPSQAQSPRFADDHGHDGTATTTPIAPSSHAEPGDDRGGASAHPEPGDDHGGATPHAEPADDHGGAAGHGGSGDDHGGGHGRG